MLFYRLVLTLFSPFLVASLVLRVLRGQESWGDFGQRLGRGVGHAGAIWVHGASNGELISARNLLNALRVQHPDIPILVTANSTSGRALVEAWEMPNATARLAPIDLRLCTGALMRNWRPRMLIVLESELWPNRIAMLGVPVLIVAARVSAKSADFWCRLPRASRRFLKNVTFLAPQDDTHANRFLRIGVPPAVIGSEINLKTDIALPPPDPNELDRLRPYFPAHQTWLAASTHEGDDEVALKALVLAQHPQRLILAPRHPNRAQDIAELARSLGLSVAQRSLDQSPDDAQVYLADTLGEMALWYSLARVTLIGGTFCDVGGHTPYEPIAYGSAIVHGPNVSAFEGIFARLDRVNAAWRVSDAPELARAIKDLLEPKAWNAVVESARRTAEEEHRKRSTLDPILQAIRSAL